MTLSPCVHISNCSVGQGHSEIFDQMSIQTWLLKLNYFFNFETRPLKPCTVVELIDVSQCENVQSWACNRIKLLHCSMGHRFQNLRPFLKEKVTKSNSKFFLHWEYFFRCFMTVGSYIYMEILTFFWVALLYFGLLDYWLGIRMKHENFGLNINVKCWFNRTFEGA